MGFEVQENGEQKYFCPCGQGDTVTLEITGLAHEAAVSAVTEGERTIVTISYGEEGAGHVVATPQHAAHAETPPQGSEVAPPPGDAAPPAPDAEETPAAPTT